MLDDDCLLDNRAFQGSHESNCMITEIIMVTDVFGSDSAKDESSGTYKVNISSGILHRQ